MLQSVTSISILPRRRCPISGFLYVPVPQPSHVRLRSCSRRVVDASRHSLSYASLSVSRREAGELSQWVGTSLHSTPFSELRCDQFGTGVPAVLPGRGLHSGTTLAHGGEMNSWVRSELLTESVSLPPRRHSQELSSNASLARQVSTGKKSTTPCFHRLKPCATDLYCLSFY